MNDCQLGTVEARFADIIWANEPFPQRYFVKKAKNCLCGKNSLPILF